MKQVLEFKNEQQRIKNKANTGKMGYPGKVVPWCHEFQFQKYFKERELDWQEVARDRLGWRQHMFNWIYDRLGCTKKNLVMK